MYQFPGFALTPYVFRCQCTGSTPVRVAPFGNPRIKGCLLLPEAYRSWPRPSSLPGAKASALCPFCLTCRSTVNPEKPSTLISGLSSKIAKINYQRASPVMNRRQSLKKRDSLQSTKPWWRISESNRRPPACKAGALPTELIPHQWWAWVDLNHRPHPYQGCALTKLSYRP